MKTVAEALQEALQHHQAGRVRQAELAYKQILEADPRQPDALHLLGVIAFQCGSNELAIQHIRAAIAQQPGFAAYHNNLGLAYRAAHQLAEARACHEEALRLDQGYAAAHLNLANVFRELGQATDSLASYRRALQLQPRSAEAHLGLGKLLQNMGRLGEALVCVEEALRLQPRFADAHHHRGEILQDLCRLDEALASYTHAVDLKPDYADAHYSAIAVLDDLGRHAEAQQWWDRLLNAAGSDGARIRAALATPIIFQSAEQMRRQRQRLEERACQAPTTAARYRRSTDGSQHHQLLRGVSRRG